MAEHKAEQARACALGEELLHMTTATHCPVCQHPSPDRRRREGGPSRRVRCPGCRIPLIQRTGDTALEVRGLRHHYGSGDTVVQAVKSFDLVVAPGEIVLVVGPSGGGKTTALLAIGMLLTPDAGSIRIGGVEGSSLRESERALYRLLHIGFVFQQFNLLGSLTATQNVALPLLYAGVRRSEAEQRAVGLLSSFGLSHRLGSLPRKMSGGEKQRVSIARAMACAPNLILADEPTANLDSQAGRVVAQQIVSAAQDAGAGVVIVTHDTRLSDVASRVMVLEDGVLNQDRRSPGREPGGEAATPSADRLRGPVPDPPLAEGR